MLEEKRIRRGKQTAAVVIAAALAATGCSSSSKSSTPTTTGSSASSIASNGSSGTTPGLTATTITLGQIADVSGPIPGAFLGAVQGLDGWAAYVNSTGGIDGRKVVIVHKDSALACTPFTNAVNAIVGTTFASVGNFSVFDQCGVTTLRQHPGYPYMPAGESVSVEPLPDVIAAAPTAKGWSTSAYVWLKKQFGQAAVEKTGALWANSPIAPLDSAEMVNAAQSVGFKYEYQRTIGLTETNFTSDVLRMKSAGVQIVDLTLLNIAELADFLQQAAQQGFHPKAIIDGSSYDTSLFKLVGPVDMSNLYFPLAYTDFLNPKPSVPEVNTMVSWTHSAHPGAAINLFTLTAWEAGLLFQSAMKSAGSPPTQSGLLAALNKTTSFNADGLIPPGNPAKRIPGACAVVVGIEKGAFKRLDPPTTGYDCSGTFVPYSGA